MHVQLARGYAERAYVTDRIVVSCSPALDAAKELFANAGFAPDIMADEGADFLDVDVADHLPMVHLSEADARSLQQECVAGYAISLLIRVKFFLKDLYILENDKCATYQPSASASKVSVDSHREHDELSPTSVV